MKRNNSRQLTCMSLGFMFLFCACSSIPTRARITLGEPKSAIFVSANNLLHQAVLEKADSLAPRVYIKAVQNYLEAEKDFERGKDIAKIKVKLKKAEELAEKSIGISRTMQSNFPELVRNRERAIAARADEMELESYREAENLLWGTASLVENNDLIPARERAQKAGKKFQKAELEAIQEAIVGALNEKIREAKKENAPVLTPETYGIGVNYRQEAIKTLEKNRDDQDTARQQAAKGEEYINKALFFTKKIKELKKNGENWEKLFLQREEDIEKFAAVLELEPSFIMGLEEPASEIEQSIEELKVKKEICKNELEKAQQSINEFKKKEDTLQSRLEQKEKSLARIEQIMRQVELEKENIYQRLFHIEEKDFLQQRKEVGGKVKKIQELFTRQEGKVSMNLRNDVTITLFGLTFESGKSFIKSNSYPLLDKIDKVARMLPDSKIRITGHTDSTGNNEFNKRLSLERAKAIAIYLNEKRAIQASRMEISGVGESKPIASNETTEGRRLNRRIEITFLAP